MPTGQTSLGGWSEDSKVALGMARLLECARILNPKWAEYPGEIEYHMKSMSVHDLSMVVIALYQQALDIGESIMCPAPKEGEKDA